MKQGPYIIKGARVRAIWFVANESGLAGCQLKVGATEVRAVGRIAHFRGDDPVNPKEIRVYIDVEEGVLPPAVKKIVPPGCLHEEGHVEIRPDWIVEVET